MSMKPKVWFVDDLPENLQRFKDTHADDFDIEVFAKTKDVLDRIHKSEYPDALLCDIFFYEPVDRARKVELEISKLVDELRKKAIDMGLHDDRHAAGIALMKNIREHFKKKVIPFPMYAYTSKGPFLLEQQDWKRISDYGAEVLLKGRVTPDSERTEIVGDIEQLRLKTSWAARFWTAMPSLTWAMITAAAGAVAAWIVTWLLKKYLGV